MPVCESKSSCQQLGQTVLHVVKGPMFLGVSNLNGTIGLKAHVSIELATVGSSSVQDCVIASKG